jgi:hypothetical protein
VTAGDRNRYNELEETTNVGLVAGLSWKENAIAKER